MVASVEDPDPMDPKLIGLLDPDPLIPNYGSGSGSSIGCLLLINIQRNFRTTFNILAFLMDYYVFDNIFFSMSTKMSRYAWIRNCKSRLRILGSGSERNICGLLVTRIT
jgi:hypothetical protein